MHLHRVLFRMSTHRRFQCALTNQVKEQCRRGRNTKRQENVENEHHQHAEGQFARGKNPDATEHRQCGPDGKDDKEHVKVTAQDIV